MSLKNVNRDVIIQSRCNRLQRITEIHRRDDAHPLIPWQDKDGYHFNIQQIFLIYRNQQISNINN